LAALNVGTPDDRILQGWTSIPFDCWRLASLPEYREGDTETTARDNPVALRRMTADDMLTLYKWQCHPDTRRFARTPDPPELEGHKKWFAERLRSKDCILTMILHAGEPAGMLRLDRQQDHSSDPWEVSILIAPEKKRLGIGASALALVRDLVASAELIAEVLPGNEASRRLFRNAGYVQERDGIYRSAPRRSQYHR
jgi:UDP-2,4-diacetamido-2,4,6-trideoxy-beta-L-altropyranose hydrolase